MDISLLHKIYIQFPIIITDSRKVVKNSIFFALKGENFNGNLYAKQAIENGARYSVIDEDVDSENSSLIKVDSVLETLQLLANFHRKQFNIPVIGITGTNGKTTSKELINAVLSEKYNVLATKGNFNNHIGVPLTLLEIKAEHDIAIIEMGANHLGEIADLCEIAKPNHGIVTNVGMAHLEGFGSFENIIKTKSALYKYVKHHNGINFSLKENIELKENLTKDYQFNEYSCKDLKCKNYGYGSINNSKLFFHLLKIEHQNIEAITIKTKMVGLYNESNIMAAITIGDYFKVSVEKIKNALENYTPTNNRSQLEKTNRNTLILDAYNANPTSVENALENIYRMDSPNKTIILGDMLELGEYSNKKHQEIVDIITDKFNGKVILVGSEYYKIDTSRNSNIFKFNSTEELVNTNYLSKIDKSLILLKGSRGIGLERLVKEL